MTNNAPIFLFIPVSSPEGIGEYMRSLIVAKQIVKIWPDAKIHFILNKQAPYSSQCPYQTFITENSPTKHIKEVNQIISQLKPDVVLFDASGRKSQLQQAKRVGAKVVFISQHKKKRSRGLKLGRILATDSHWVVQPKFVLGEINAFDKLKLALCNKAAPVRTGVIFTPPEPEQQALLLAKYGVEREQFLIFNAGSGGHLIGEQLAADVYAQAANLICEQHKIKCLMVYGSNYPKPIPETGNVIAIAQLTNSDFINLMSAATAVILSGGDTLLQAIAMRKPCLATAVSKDQSARISACLEQQLILACDTNILSIAEQVTQLLTTPVQRQLNDALASSSQPNGIDVALSELKRLLA